LNPIRITLAAAIAVAVAVLPSTSMAQAFPNRAVRVIMPYPVGGGPDNTMRLIGEKLSKMWGQPVLVENKTGGNGRIGIDAVKSARPDGYTLLMVDAALFCLQPHLFKQMSYDPFKDFEAVAPVFSTNFFMVVKADSKWKTVGDLIASAKEQPGKVVYGSSGIGSQYHLGGSMIETGTGVSMTHVPYRETMQIFTDIVGGSGVDWSFATASTAAALYQAKKLKYLAIAAPKRHPSYPDVPTVSESGGPANMELRTWVGLFAPAGTPKEAIDRVSADVAKVMLEPELKSRLNTVGLNAWSAPAVDLKKALEDDYRAYGEIAKRTKIELQ
jgi:tripartite-type tricarboxylate transporter receptor subunit TctC